MAEPIKMPFGLRTRVGPGNHVLDGVQITPHKGGIFKGNDMPGHSWWHSAVSCAKIAELIEMPFGCRLRWAQATMYQMEVQIIPCTGAIFPRKNMPGHAQRHSAMSCAKMAEPIEMQFGLWTWMGPRKHLLLPGEYDWTVHMMQPFCQITLTTFYYYFIVLFHVLPILLYFNILLLTLITLFWLVSCSKLKKLQCFARTSVIATKNVTDYHLFAHLSTNVYMPMALEEQKVE